MSMIWSNLDLNRSSFPLFSGFLDRIAARLAATKRIIIRPAWDSPKANQDRKVPSLEPTSICNNNDREMPEATYRSSRSTL